MEIIHDLAQKLIQMGRELSHENLSFDISTTTNPSQGDITSNIALIHFKKMGCGSPREAAVRIAAAFEQMKDKRIDRIEVAGPGFINFFLSDVFLRSELKEIVQKGNEYGKKKANSNQSIIIEFGDPNPFKEIHIGHLRNFCIGESFSKLLETQGNTITKANYQGDVGMHVAKTIWGILKREEQFLDSSVSEQEKVAMLAQSYVEGARAYEESEESKQAIQDINKKIYEQDSSLYRIWEEGRKVSLEHFEELYKRLGVSYDTYYFESNTAVRGKEVVLSHIDDGIFERNDGAVVYRGEQDGLHTRVFLTSQNYATYEGKDLALALMKQEDGSYDKSIILTGNEQAEYFQVMLAALKKINPSLVESTQHLTFGHVRLKEGKMSSRTGDVITASWLLDEAVKRVKDTFPDSNDATAEVIGVGAVKYSMLKFGIPSDIHFSFDESISLDGNSGPYLQYAYVRTQSVLEKAEGKELVEKSDLPLETEEEQLVRYLVQYPYYTEVASSEFSPNIICNYLFELCQKYNAFYQKCKIIGSENEAFRVELTRAVGQVLANGLYLLSIPTVSKM